jgi:hypothetical protein
LKTLVRERRTSESDNGSKENRISGGSIFKAKRKEKYAPSAD